MTPSFKSNTRKDGEAVLKVERKIKQVNYESNVIYNEDNELGSLNTYCVEVDCEFYLIGDLEFLFMMVGRLGF